MSNQYDKLDSLIVEAIKAGGNSFSLIFLRMRVFDEANRIAQETNRVPDRIVVGRLQALRKRGLIVHVNGWGWRVKEAA